MRMFEPIETITTAKIDGKIVEYDMCRPVERGGIECPNFRYIGTGKIHEVNGVRQSFEGKFHFFRANF